MQEVEANRTVQAVLVGSVLLYLCMFSPTPPLLFVHEEGMVVRIGEAMRGGEAREGESMGLERLLIGVLDG